MIPEIISMKSYYKKFLPQLQLFVQLIIVHVCPQCLTRDSAVLVLHVQLAWTLKAYEEIKQNDYPENGLSAAFLYSMAKSIDGEANEEGTYPLVAMKVLQKFGICPKNVMPYHSLTEIPEPKVPAVLNIAKKAAISYKIKTYAQICEPGSKSRDNLLTVIRRALKREGPFIMALLVTENFEPNANGMLPEPAGMILGGHAVGIVGDMPDKKR